MTTPRRRPPFATGAFFRPLLATALVAALSAGCVSLRKSGKARDTAPTILPPRHIEIGRIHSFDASSATAVIEFVPQFRGGAPLNGTKLIARKLDTLEPTAHLVASPYQNNRTLGAYVTAGAPGLDDEVVIAPESALPESAGGN